jgi:hypothetical protein
MKARKITFSHWRVLFRSLGHRLRTHPREFFLPPKREKDPVENPSPPPPQKPLANDVERS